MRQHPANAKLFNASDPGLPSKPGGGVAPSAGVGLPRGSCAGTTAPGMPCLAAVQTGSRFCYFHDPAKAEERGTARRMGGRQRSRPAAVLDAETPAKEIGCVADVRDLLSETIHQVRTGAIDPKVANCVGYLSGVLLKALEVGELEDRVRALESIVRHGSRTGSESEFDRPFPERESLA